MISYLTSFFTGAHTQNIPYPGMSGDWKGEWESDIGYTHKKFALTTKTLDSLVSRIELRCDRYNQVMFCLGVKEEETVSYFDSKHTKFRKYLEKLELSYDYSEYDWSLESPNFIFTSLKERQGIYQVLSASNTFSESALKTMKTLANTKDWSMENFPKFAKQQDDDFYQEAVPPITFDKKGYV